MKIKLIIILALSNAACFAQALISDTLFGNNGQLSTLVVGNSTANKILMQPDNKIILCGYNYDFNCNCLFNDMVRTDACGNLDSTFGENGTVHHTFDQRNVGIDYVLQPDGKILVSGVQSDGNAGSQQFPYIARYNSDGSVDSSFGNNGTNKINYLGPGVFSSIYLMDRSKILCTGSPNGNSNLIMRFDSAGAVDNTFGTNGVVQHAIPPGVNFFYDFKSVLRSDGKIVSVAPAYLGVANNKNVVLSCYDTLGMIDTTFGSNGFYIDYNFVIGNGLLIALQSDNKIIVGQQNISETAVIIARYTTNGNIDTTYGVNGYINIPAARIQLLTKFNDDKILVGYQENGVAPVFKKFNTNGVEDTNFSLNGGSTFEFANNDKARTAIVTANSEVLMGGSDFAFSMTRFVLGSSIPNITQNGASLNSNVTNSGATFQWFIDGTEIPNATNSSIEVTQNGMYTVVVENSWGCQSSDDFQMLTLGLNEIKTNNISIYPNPSCNVVTVQFSNTVLQTTVLLFDVVGKNVFENLISNTSSTQIDVSAFAKGMYNLQIITNEVKSNYKIIVQ